MVNETYVLDARLILGGYVSNVKVCWDENANYACDDDNSSIFTDEEGIFHLSFTEAQKNSISETGYLDLVTLVPAGSASVVFGAPGTVASDVTVNTRVYDPKFRNYKDDISSYTNVNIFESLAALTFGADETPTADEFGERLDRIAAALGLKAKTVRGNYNNPKKTSEENVRAVISGEVIQEYGILPGSFKALQEQKKNPVDIDALVANLEQIRTIVDPIVASMAELAVDDPDTAEIITEMVDSSQYLDAGFASLASGNGDNFMCGVTGAGTVKCWGQGSWGNLGNGEWYEDALSKNPVDPQAETRTAADPTTLPDMYTHEPQTVTKSDGSPLTGVARVETGLHYACAVTVTGEVWCWGSNYYGQLGNDSIDLESPIVPVATRVVKGRQEAQGKYFSNAVDIYLANYTACARTADKDLYCWGDNTMMQTGDSRPDDEVTEPYADLCRIRCRLCLM